MGGKTHQRNVIHANKAKTQYKVGFCSLSLIPRAVILGEMSGNSKLR